MQLRKKAPPSPLPRFRVHFFCKTLTLQTQVHMFGFMYIDWCLYISKLIFLNFVLKWSLIHPFDSSLRISGQSPYQELVAKVLHANEWRFQGIGNNLLSVFFYFCSMNLLCHKRSMMVDIFDFVIARWATKPFASEWDGAYFVSLMWSI